MLRFREDSSCWISNLGLRLIICISGRKLRGQKKKKNIAAFFQESPPRLLSRKRSGLLCGRSRTHAPAAPKLRHIESAEVDVIPSANSKTNKVPKIMFNLNITVCRCTVNACHA